MGCSHDKPENPNKKLIKIKNAHQKPFECKIVFLGDSGVGKSSVSQRYCNNIFNENYEVTIGGAYLQNQITLKTGQQLKMHLWDTGGEERFRAMAPLYYRDANAAILVYDVSDSKSFSSIEFWYKELENLVKQEGMVLAIAGNKADLPDKEKKITTEMGKSYAEKNKMIFSETSAKNGDGIFELFKNVGEEIGKNMNKALN